MCKKTNPIVSVMYVSRTYTLTYEHTSTWLCRRQWSVLTAHISPFVVAERRLLALTSECFQTLSVSCSPREHSSVPPSPVLREHLGSSFEVSKTDVYFWIAALFFLHTHTRSADCSVCLCFLRKLWKRGAANHGGAAEARQHRKQPNWERKKKRERENISSEVCFALAVRIGKRCWGRESDNGDASQRLDVFGNFAG